MKLWILLIAFTTPDGNIEQMIGLPPVKENTEQSCRAAAELLRQTYGQAPNARKFKAECGVINVSPYLGRPA